MARGGDDVRGRIDSLCALRADLAHAGGPALFARIYDGRESGTWRQATAGVLARIARDPDIYSEVATVRFVAGNVAIVDVATRSVDYAADAAYCFRASGSLARVNETSSGTANSDDEARYLDESGRIVARSSKLASLAPQPGATVSPDVKPALPELYRTVRALPFFALLAGGR